MWVYIWGKSRLVEFWVELGEHYQEIMGKRANAPEILYKLVGVQRHIKEGVPVLCMNCSFQDYLKAEKYCQHLIPSFYRTQVNLGSDSWVRLSLTDVVQT